MRISWNDPTPPYESATRTGLTTGRVYEIRQTELDWELWARPRARLVGIPLEEQWEQLGDYPTVAVAIVAAQMDEDADEAGRQAAAEAIELLRETGGLP